MPIVDVPQLETAVDMFRRRAQQLFHAWAWAWCRQVHPTVAEERSHLLSALILVYYWEVYRRHPTIHEWVDDFQLHIMWHQPLVQMKERLRARAAHSEDTFNILKPFWSLYQMADQNMNLALRRYSEQVGMAFMTRRPLNVPTTRIQELLAQHDVTKTAEIQSIVGSVRHTPSRWARLKLWWRKRKKSV